MATILIRVLSVLAIGGLVTTLIGWLLVVRWSTRIPAHGQAEPASLLKPLYGAEPRLAENLGSFLDQAWDAPIEMICGVQRKTDPAREVLASLADARSIEVCDPTAHGANAKIGNLINMAPSARHDLIVMSDSDMAVPRDYLAILAGTLARPGVGAATCLYRGRGDAGPWSQLAAAVSSYHFLPVVLLGLFLNAAKPCMGSTIALRRETLAAIGGFQAFADRIADDYDIGRAIEALGLKVAIPPMLLVHAATESDLPALWRHEMRWSTTLRVIDPAGYAGTAFTYPLPFALALVPLSPHFGLVLTATALASRLLLKRAVDRWAGASSCPAWMLPLRDCLSLAVFLSAFFTRSVDWRGSALRMTSKGRIAAAPELPRR